MRTLLRLWLLLLAFVPIAAQAQVSNAGAAFDCDGKLYQTRQATANSTFTTLYRVNRSTTPYTTDRFQLTGQTNANTYGDLGVRLNAVGYNQRDNFLYAVTYANGATSGAINLYRIGRAGAQSLGRIYLDALGTNPLPTENYAGGAVDQNGIMYISEEGSSNRIYRIDLNTLVTSTTRVVASTISLGANYTFYDLAINPLTNDIYGSRNEGQLYRIVPNTLGIAATVTNVSSTTAVNGAADPVGTLFFDAAGTLLAASNGSIGGNDAGNFYVIDVASSSTSSTWVNVTTLPRSAQSDGASCVNPPQRIDVVKSVGTVTAVNGSNNLAFNVPYTIKVKNTGEIGNNATNIQISDFLFKVATGNSNNNITFPAALIPDGTANTSRIQNLRISDDDPDRNYTLNSTGATAFNGTSANSGARAGMLTTGQTLFPGYTITVTFTAQVRFANAASVPAAVQLNTAIASSATSSNAGYALNGSTGTYLPPIDLLAADQSTDGTTLPNTANGDVASPTPVNFTPGIGGNVFEDVNYGGGPGRDQATSSGAAVVGATVELYGNGIARRTTTTDVDGYYYFGGLTAGTNYTVRVVNSTVRSTRPGGTTNGLLPVQTYANGSKVGGNNPSVQDPAAGTTNTLPANSQSTLVVQPAFGSPTDASFGFNFDVIVNTNASGQGSLNQFIANSNALLNDNSDLSSANDLFQDGLTPGVETSIFMIPASALVNGVAIINQTVNMNPITGFNTAIDGTTQTTNSGDTNTGTLGTGGTVGTAGTALGTVNRPEVQIVGSTARPIGLDIRSTATNTLVQGISIYGFNDANISVAGASSIITGNVIGNSASIASFTTAPPVATGGNNIRVSAAADVQISNNLIGYANLAGVFSTGTNLTITGNEFFTNGRADGQGYSGINLNGSSTSVTNNLFVSHPASAIDAFNSAGSNTVTGNSITNNGYGLIPQAVRLGGAGSSVSQNLIYSNFGNGIFAGSGSSNNVFSQNSIYGNGNVSVLRTGRIGIDLEETGQNTAGPYVTINDIGDADTGGNGALNYPVITSATIRNGNLLLTGFARSATQIEFFLAEPNPAAINAVGANFGQGKTYLFTRTEGTSGNAQPTLNDLNTGTGSYSGPINGFDQGAENNQNRFAFTIPLASLTAAQQAALTADGALLTATGTVSGQGTSEFSGNAPVMTAPLAVNDATTTTPGTQVTLTVTSNDQTSIDLTSVALNGLAAGSTSAVSVTTGGVTAGSFQFTSNGQVQFTPAAGFTGVATVPYTVNNTSGITSNTAFITVEVRNPSIDLSTSITAPTNNSAVNAGATVTYTVNASNATGTPVSNVVETLQLPAGLGTVTVNGGSYSNSTAQYDNATGLVTLNVGTLNGNATQTYSVVVSAMPGSGPITATANIRGTGVETTTSNNVATATVSINARYDVATTISGPATGVVQGGEVTYTVTTSNLSTTTGSVSPAPNVVQKARIPSGLTGVFASNGGTYNSANGEVTFPAIGMLPLGQTVVNSISFAAPSAATFTVPSATVTAGASNDNAGDLNSSTTGTNNNTAYLNGLASNATVATAAPSSTNVNVYTSISSSATSVAPNASVTLTVTAANAGPSTAAAVTETMLLPAGLSGVTVSNGGSYNSTTGLVTFTSFGPLAPASSANATVTFNAPAQGIVLATATVGTTSNDLVAADNLAQIKVEIAALTDVATTLAGPATATPGQAIAYTVTTTNVGQSPALGVVQTVSLPTGLSNVTVSGSGSYDAATGLVTFTLSGPLAKGATQTNTISYTVPTGASNFTAVANVATTSAETAVSNNVASVVTTVQPVADLLVSATGPATVAVGGVVTYTVTTANNGPSTATGVVPTLQLPANLPGSVSVAGGGSYDAASGLVTFSTVASMPSGSSTSRTVTFTMPDVSGITGVARATTSTGEVKLDNNYTSVATTALTAPATTVNLSASITASASPVVAGASTSVTAVFSNAAGSAPANDVAPSILLPANLSGVNVTGGTGGSYNSTTGLVTWNSVESLAGGSSLTGTYRVTYNAPTDANSYSPVAFVASSDAEAAYSDNVSSTTVNITPSSNVTTSISGPASALPGAAVTYTITTLNNGASPATATQRVTIPAGATNIVYSGANGPISAANGTTTITFPVVSNQPVGTAAQVTNYVTFTAPNTTFAVTAQVTGGTTGNNSAPVTTRVNQTPIAYNVVNALQTPQATTAGPLLISPLVATDADAGTTLSYRITSLPSTAAGILYLGAGTSTPVALNTPLTAAQISTLRFDPVTNFIGNAFFTYTATDNAATPATSNTAIYTIAVGQDASSTYTAAPNKGGSVSNYATGDLIGYVSDANSFRYANSGLLYNTATSNGVLVGNSTGVVTASISAADATSLSNVGLTFVQTAGTVGGVSSAIGEIRVTNRNLLRGGNYPITITTVDANGGTNTIPASVVIGFGPLPVTLVEFSAKAQNNNDAVLTWATAQEKNNDHFDVERSIDGVSFVKVGQRAGHGNSTTTQQYSFTDEGAARLAGTVYYRLRQVDTDGTPTNSDVRTVAFAKSSKLELTVYPNPATDKLNVRLDGQQEASVVLIFNTAGMRVLEGKLAGSLSTSFEVRTLPAGTYLVQVKAANGQILTSRFVKY